MGKYREGRLCRGGLYRFATGYGDLAVDVRARHVAGKVKAKQLVGQGRLSDMESEGEGPTA